MFDHFGLTVTDMAKSLPFYEACLRPLGITVIQRQPDAKEEPKGEGPTD